MFTISGQKLELLLSQVQNLNLYRFRSKICVFTSQEAARARYFQCSSLLDSILLLDKSVFLMLLVIRPHPLLDVAAALVLRRVHLNLPGHRSTKSSTASLALFFLLKVFWLKVFWLKVFWLKVFLAESVLAESEPR